MMTGRFVPVTDVQAHGPAIAFVSDREVSSEAPGVASTVPAETLLVFPDHKPQTQLTWHNGWVASGIPVQLLFWGDYWDQQGAALRTELIDKVQELLGGPYFEALGQYGIAKPIWGGAHTVIQPGPPDGDFDGSDVGGMAWKLLNDGVFPKPGEDGGYNAYYAMMPPGATMPGADGAHGARHPASWMLWTDTVLVGWSVWHPDADSMLMTFSHEMVELTTDPDHGGWYNDDLDHKEGELSDLCQPNGWQSAFVGGVKVMPYWSARDQACVVPTFPLTVRIDGHMAVDAVHDTGSGDKEHPFSTGDHHDLCTLLPACCFSGPYHWTDKRIDETATLAATTSGFHAPTVAWQIEGQPANGNGSIVARVAVTRESDSGVTYDKETVTLKFTQNGNRLTVSNDSVTGTFDVVVTVQVDEGSVSASGGTSAQGGRRVARCVLPFRGQTFSWDDRLERDREACNRAADELWKETHRKTADKIGPIDPGDLRPHDREILARAGAGVLAETMQQARTALSRAGALRLTHPQAAEELRHALLNSLGMHAPRPRR